MHVPANVRLNRFTARAITPVVLLGGLLLLAVYNFNGLLKLTQQQDKAFHSLTVMSAGPLQITFQRDSGDDRPLIQWNGYKLMTYADWTSTISVDGHVGELWNNQHGYTFDEAERRIVVSTSGDYWQLIEVISLLDSHHAKIDFSFVARGGAAQPPQTLVLNMLHVRTLWYQPAVGATSFTAQVPAISGQAALAGRAAASIGTIKLDVTGPAVVAGGVALGDIRAITKASTQQQTWASQLTTTYQVAQLPIDRLLPLGSELLTFTPNAANAGTPVAAPVQTPQP
ncbi:MAG TPA: hypothetical protein VF916_08355 [Ktedonobacterales bacterium]